ncbi:ROK family protein, partial [Mesorhizobium sp. M2A.F.Ca.ET.046.02.1.1]
LYNGGSGNAGEIGRALLSPAGPGSTPLEHRASLASLYQHLGLDPAERGLYEKLGALALAQDARVMSWVERAASDLRWSVHLIETIFDPQTVILTSTAPEALARLLHQAMHPLLPSIADQPARRLPRLQLGTTDPWAIAVGAAAEPISRAFDPRFSAILKAG